MGKLGWFISKTWTATSPPCEGEPAGTQKKDWGSLMCTTILVRAVHTKARQALNVRSLHKCRLGKNWREKSGSSCHAVTGSWTLATGIIFQHVIQTATTSLCLSLTTKPKMHFQVQRSLRQFELFFSAGNVWCQLGLHIVTRYLKTHNWDRTDQSTS